MALPALDLYQRYGPALLRKCRRLLGNPHDPEDIVQGLFLDLIQKGAAEPDLPYLYRAVTNRCLNLIRDRRKQRELLERHDELLRGPVRTPFEERVVTLDLLCQALGRLDDRCGEVLIFRHFDDMSSEEIAAMLGTSARTVNKRLEKAHGMLRKLGAGAAPAGGAS